MKKLFYTWLVCIPLIGCVTPYSPGGHKEASQDTIDKAVILLNSAAFSASVVAINRDPSVRDYISYAAEAIDVIIGERDFSPDLLKKILETHPKASVRDVVLVINTISLTYELYFDEYVAGSDQVNNAVRFLASLKNGLDKGLILTENGVTSGELEEAF